MPRLLVIPAGSGLLARGVSAVLLSATVALPWVGAQPPESSGDAGTPSLQQQSPSSSPEVVVPLTPPSSAGPSAEEPQPKAQPEGVLPPLPPEQQQRLESQQGSLTRADMAAFIVNWFKLETQPFNEFPIFVDVPRSHPRYAMIDTVRRNHLMLPNSRGEFEPNARATRLDAWMALAKLLFPKNQLSDAEANSIMAPLPGQERLKLYEKKRVARLFMGNVLTPETDTPIEPEAPLDAQWLSATLERLSANRQRLKEQETQRAGSETPAIPIPPGITLHLTPSQAIVAGTIALGSDYFFQLVEETRLPNGSLLPPGSSLKGHVVEIAENRYRFAFYRLSHAQTGQLFQLQASVWIALKAAAANEGDASRDNPSLLITGNVVTVQTEPLPEAMLAQPSETEAGQDAEPEGEFYRAPNDDDAPSDIPPGSGSMPQLSPPTTRHTTGDGPPHESVPPSAEPGR